MTDHDCDAPEPETDRRSARERDGDAARRRGARELRIEIDDRCELAAAGPQGALVDRRERRRREGDHEERGGAERRFLVTRALGARQHVRTYGGLAEEQEDPAPDCDPQSAPVRREQRHCKHIEEHQEQQRAARATSQGRRQREERPVQQEHPRHQHEPALAAGTAEDLHDEREAEVHGSKREQTPWRVAREQGDTDHRQGSRDAEHLEETQPLRERCEIAEDRR